MLTSFSGQILCNVFLCFSEEVIKLNSSLAHINRKSLFMVAIVCQYSGYRRMKQSMPTAVSVFVAYNMLYLQWHFIAWQHTMNKAITILLRGSK